MKRWYFVIEILNHWQTMIDFFKKLNWNISEIIISFWYTICKIFFSNFCYANKKPARKWIIFLFDIIYLLLFIKSIIFCQSNTPLILICKHFVDKDIILVIKSILMAEAFGRFYEEESFLNQEDSESKYFHHSYL
jgi:hypothetical protein